LVVLVAVQLSVPGLYLPPVLKILGGIPSTPDDHFTASPHHGVLKSASGRIGGAGGCPSVRARLVTPASIQKIQVIPSTQMIISLLVQTDVGKPRADGALVVLVAVQLSVPGLYFPSSFKAMPPKNPPQTIISLPDQTAVCSYRPWRALVVLVAVQLSVLGLYLAPVFKRVKPPGSPPHTIISLPVQTAVWPARALGALVVLVAVHVSSLHAAPSDIVGSV
jgi:hypothetical protein